MSYTRPFRRVIDAVAEIAKKRNAIAENTGDRLADSLEAISKSGVAAKQDASTAADAASLKADFNALLVKLKNAGLMEADAFSMTVTKDVVDSISGRADRQYNTNQIASVSEDDGVITITLSKPVDELKWFNAGGKWGVHKWLGIGISVGINPITGLKYNGTQLSSEDVTEATQVGLSAGYFVRWVAADLVLYGNNTDASKDMFILSADGYKNTQFTIKIVEP
jgi:hypothetical protein